MDRQNTKPPNPEKLDKIDVGTAPAFHWQNSPLLRRDVLGASLGVNLFSLGLPMVVLQVYDRIIPNQATSTLLLLVMGLMVVLVLDSILKTARAHLAGWIGARFEHRVGMESVEKFCTPTRAQSSQRRRAATWTVLPALTWSGISIRARRA